MKFSAVFYAAPNKGAILYLEMHIMVSSDYFSVIEIQQKFGCGRQKAYQIVNSKGFPKTKIGRTYYIDKAEFEKWRKRNLYLEVYI